MSNKNEVFEYLIDQLRQQVNNNQCEDLAHEVQSLKNQLRDARAQIKELYETISELNRDLAAATGDIEAYKLTRKCEHGPEQSGCRKEDVQECVHIWGYYPDECLFKRAKCGVTKSGECEHDWEYYYPNGRRCTKCGVINL